MVYEPYLAELRKSLSKLGARSFVQGAAPQTFVSWSAGARNQVARVVSAVRNYRPVRRLPG
jgi:hypothetical protein